MNSRQRVRLQVDEGQRARLTDLCRLFSQACTELAKTAKTTGVWGRVGLHQLAYRQTRAAFPLLGSQMTCNAIYSVSRVCRQIYQSPQSPFALQKVGLAKLPVLQFSAAAPVYFDRHTLSIKGGMASLYTLDGRMRFHLPLAEQDERRFHECKLLEVALESDADGFMLTFQFADPSLVADSEPASAEWPDYLVLLTSSDVDDTSPVRPVLPVPVPTSQSPFSP